MIRIVLADDHKLFAQGVARLLGSDDALSIDAIFDSGQALITYLGSHKADVALIDLNMPQPDGLETIRQIRQLGYPCKLIVLSMYAEEPIFKKCIDAGIDAYLLKDSEPEELIDTIKEVVEGQYQINFQRILKQTEPFNQVFPDEFLNRYRLSNRELEIVQNIKEGLTSQQISDKLFLSIFTVQTHRKNILQKMQVSNTIELLNVVNAYL